MTGQELAEKTARGISLSRSEFDWLARGAADLSLSDEELLPWLRAAFDHGLDLDQTADLTMAMADSGEKLDLSRLPRPWLDKHSTGGVGDKTTLVLVPLLAACGLTVVKMSGRALGITGGTIDKLESVPGFETSLTPEQMIAQADKIGLALTGQTPRLAPADGRLYALRDAHGLVASLPLIVSSILSKKIASGAEMLVLDVKCGSGAFMQDLDEAKRLREWLILVGEKAGLKVHADITDMDQPLGRAVGNALEVREAVKVLRGEETGRFYDLCLHFALAALNLAGIESPQEKIDSALATGGAIQAAMHWFHEQGASLEVFEEEDDLPNAPIQREVFHEGPAGWVVRIDARTVGQFVLDIGGGRKVKGAPIDHAVGVVLDVQVGDRVETGQRLFTAHLREEGPIPQLIAVAANAVAPRSVILSA